MSRIRVLIIDDSAFARKVIREVLSRDFDIEVVGIARDGLEGLEKVLELKPDVVTLDLVMPDLDGLGFLKALKKLEVVPKVLIVSVSGSNTDLAIQALELGAIDVVTKPTPLPTDRLYELADDLIAKVKAAAIANEAAFVRSSELTAKNHGSIATRKPEHAKLVVIGTSTGGPQALSLIFKMLPAEFPLPIAVALHIPAGYTAPLAARISQNSAIKLVEATDGMPLVAGQAVIAPGGLHLQIMASDNGFFARVSIEPVESIYHPSVDILFSSAAKSAGRGALAVILTGMGSDGTIGAGEIKKAGGRVLAESAASCIVFGMPRSVIEAGYSLAEAPLENIARLIVEHI